MRQNVALRKESVDRNVAVALAVSGLRVALRKESVDRNPMTLRAILVFSVALRKESVDRNQKKSVAHKTFDASLSARRAWIEIVRGTITAYPVFPSLSARRAWIEILYTSATVSWVPVALRKESVDRNASVAKYTGRPHRSLSARRAWIEIVIPFYLSPQFASRSPQGERG